MLRAPQCFAIFCAVALALGYPGPGFGQFDRSASSSNFAALLARAEQGDAQAELEQGRAYRSGILVKQDSQEAALWLLKSADKDNVEALLELAFGYRYGLFGEKAPDKAVQFYVRAAQLGSKDARFDLTQLYTQGAEGFPSDFDQAAHWANCPKPTTSTMKACKSVTYADLPKPALALLRHMKCYPGSNYDYGAELHLLSGSSAPYYQVCCHDVPHGPCPAVIIGQVSGKWKEVGNEGGVLGFDEACGGSIILETSHAGLHDLCRPDLCSTPNPKRCDPLILRFNGVRYVPLQSSP